MHTRLPIATLAVTLLTLLAPPVLAGEDEPVTEHENTLRWSTASEVDNFGFDVYRSDSADGPFEKINEKVIRGAGTTDVPHYYVYEDREIDPRRAYYYYVESVSIHGERQRFTPVIRAKPRISDEEAKEGSEDAEGESGREEADSKPGEGEEDRRGPRATS